LVEVIELKNCPACKSATLHPAFASETHRHNSLARMEKNLPAGVDAAFVRAFDKIHWKICGHCGLIFAGSRPPGTGSSPWYLPLFKISEERGYDTYPLPQSYVESKAKSNKRLYDIIAGQGLVPKNARLLHVRCATGELLRLAKENVGADVWGLDFFAACVTHANAMLGETRVAQMLEPEPQNPFPQKKFDVIIANHMATHAHDPATLMGHFRDWLADDGVLIVHNEPDHAQTLKSFRAYPRGINFFHKQLFTEDTFVSSMKSWGFEPVRIHVAGNDARKFEKNMMFACRRRDTHDGAKVDANKSVRLLKSWEWRRRIAELLRLVPA
jgi:SAM-dependent methyltransferase